MTAPGARARWRWPALLALVLVVLVAGWLRFWNLRDLPAGFYCDEAANGYNAYSLLKTGRDEHGVRWPLFVWSFQTAFKNPVYIYSTMAPVALLGLNEASTRATAALYGVLTVVAVAWLGAELFGVTAGLAAAAFLAVQPWHLHFSRIAFELICFPFLFVLALAMARRAMRGPGRWHWRWHVAALLFGLCPYAYAPAKVFTPLFLAWFVFVYPEARRQGRWALLTYVLITVPWIRFDWVHSAETLLRLRTTSITTITTQPLALAWTYLWYYVMFLTPHFLFQQGDPLVRHAVRGFGELSLTSAPFVALGVLACARLGRDGLLLLGWLLLYPATAALQTEVPSATHGIIGAPAFALLAGVGVQAAGDTIARLRRRSLARAIGIVGALAVVAALGLETARYWRAYSSEYPKYAAAGWEGFQYGYRDTIRFMEQQRPHYDQLLLTDTEVNQPYIFTLFYRPVDPAAWQQDRESGYSVVNPGSYAGFDVHRRTLFALRPQDLLDFSDYTVEHTVVAPGGQREFVITDVRGRKVFIDEWRILGLFDNRNDAGARRDDIEVGDIQQRYPGKFGEATWKYFRLARGRVDLNMLYRLADRDNPGNPEWVCAYLAAFVEAPAATPAYLELNGTDDRLRVWLDNKELTGEPVLLDEQPQRRPIVLEAGWNELVLKSCERIGYWWLQARLTDRDGRDLKGVDWRTAKEHWRRGPVAPYDGVAWKPVTPPTSPPK